MGYNMAADKSSINYNHFFFFFTNINKLKQNMFQQITEHHNLIINYSLMQKKNKKKKHDRM